MLYWWTAHYFIINLASNKNGIASLKKYYNGRYNGRLLNWCYMRIHSNLLVIKGCSAMLGLSYFLWMLRVSTSMLNFTSPSYWLQEVEDINSSRMYPCTSSSSRGH